MGGLCPRHQRIVTQASAEIVAYSLIQHANTNSGRQGSS